MLLPAEECELPPDATLEILAGDLVLKSVNTVLRQGLPLAVALRTRARKGQSPLTLLLALLLPPRPERDRTTKANITSGGSGKRGTSDGASNAGSEKSAALYLVYGG